MARRSQGGDYVRLLDDQDDDLVSLNDGQGTRRRKPPSSEGDHAHSFGSDREPSSLAPVVAVFIVEFDPKLGHTLAWSEATADIDFKGIEFKAVPSGAHTVSADVIYFKHGFYYGLACFGSIIDEASVRGAVFKSVGVLGGSYEAVARCRGKLENELKQIMRASAPTNGLRMFLARPDVVPETDADSVVFERGRQILMENGSLTTFLNQMGSDIFRLWKLALLRKRVMFLGNPPVEALCQQVLLCSNIGVHNLGKAALRNSYPLFYVDLNDIDRLGLMDTYVACSTELIFEIKVDQYDALVKTGELRIRDEKLRRACSVSSSVKQQFNDLMGRSGSSSNPARHLERFFGFFAELNEKVLSTLYSTGKISPADVRSMGLDPADDVLFLRALSTVHELNVEIEDDVWCPQTLFDGKPKWTFSWKSKDHLLDVTGRGVASREFFPRRVNTATFPRIDAVAVDWLDDVPVENFRPG